EAELHVLADAAAHVQARIAAEQVPAVVDFVALGDLDVAATAAAGLQPELHALVVAARLVLQRVEHAVAGVALDDFPTAVADRLHAGGVVQARTDAGIRAGQLQPGLRIVEHQRIPVVEALEAVQRVEHDGALAVGLDLLDD